MPNNKDDVTIPRSRGFSTPESRSDAIRKRMEERDINSQDVKDSPTDRKED